VDEKVAKAIKECERDYGVRSNLGNNGICYEDSEGSVNITIDDVGVKREG